MIKEKFNIIDDQLAKDYVNEAWFNDRKKKEVDHAASSDMIPWTRKANLAACAGFKVVNLSGRQYDSEPNFTHYYNTIKYKR